MIVYGVLISITFVVYALFSNRVDTKQNNAITIATFFVGYLVLLCLRDVSIGVDTKHYLESFWECRETPWIELYRSEDSEVGFLTFAKCLGYFSSERLFMAVVAILSVFPIMKFYSSESEDAMLCCSFFFISLLFEMFFSGMRQSISIGLVVPAFYFAKQRKVVPYFLIILLATSFHTSAIILTAIWPIYHLNIRTKSMVIIAPLMVIVFLYNEEIFKAILNLVGGKYIAGYEYLINQSSQKGLMYLFILIMIYSFIVMDENIASKDDVGMRNLLLFATCLQLFSPVHPVISRLNYYFIVFIPVALSRVNTKCSVRYLQVVRLASAVMSLYFLFYFFFSKADSLNVFNYKFFF